MSTMGRQFADDEMADTDKLGAHGPRPLLILSMHVTKLAPWTAEMRPSPPIRRRMHVCSS